MLFRNVTRLTVCSVLLVKVPAQTWGTSHEIVADGGPHQLESPCISVSILCDVLSFIAFLDCLMCKEG